MQLYSHEKERDPPSVCARIQDVSVHRTKDAGLSKGVLPYPLATDRDPNVV